MLRYLVLSFILLLLTLTGWCQNYSLSVSENSNKWVDSVFSILTIDEKIGQILMVAAYSNKGESHVKEVSLLIEKYHLGGLIFFQGGPLRQAKQTNIYQSLSEIPLLIAMDAEWGLSMRLDSTLMFPYQMTLGSMQDDQMIYKMGKEIARQCKRLGVHVNFAPVIDINNNPNNPVIGYRAFGENKYNVTQKGIAYIKGLQDGGVIAVGKHFPGHGDTDTDSHHTLPVIKHSKRRLKEVELYPFKNAIENGVGGIMVAHLNIPSLDRSDNKPATLSYSIVNNLLKEKMDFKGLIFTDALNMKGVTSNYRSGEIEVKALIAGNDVLLFPENVAKAVKSIKKALKDGIISNPDIDNRVKKILTAKFGVGLPENKLVELDNLFNDLNTIEAELLKQQLHEQSLVLLNNNDLLPLKMLDTLSISTLAVGEDSINDLQKVISKYVPCNHYQISKSPGPKQVQELLHKLEKSDLVIISLHDLSKYASKGFGVTPETKSLINVLMDKTNIIVAIFGSPYSLKFFDNSYPILVAHQDNSIAQKATAEVIFGAIPVSGKLPVSASKEFPEGVGDVIESTIRLKYTSPSELGISQSYLLKIDSIANYAIEEKATPGCQILIAKDGKVFYQKSFGYHTYDKVKPVKNTDLYDLASITKIASTVPTLMQLYDLGLLDVDKPLSNYLPDLDGTNKRKMEIRHILTHQAGLKAWIPFWTSTVSDGNYLDMYSSVKNKEFLLRVADSLYIKEAYGNTIMEEIIDSKVKRWRKEYLYSDLGFYMFKKISEDMIRSPIEEYVSET
ncbi:MAG: serine hydrolase, partial [Bacteroidia bacterium]|nr:serine hydrolase [Bacteroidia bacterium]